MFDNELASSVITIEAYSIYCNLLVVTSNSIMISIVSLTGGNTRMTGK